MKPRYKSDRSRTSRIKPPSHCAACARGLWSFRLLRCPRSCGATVCRDVDRCLDDHLRGCPNVPRRFTDSPGSAA